MSQSVSYVYVLKGIKTADVNRDETLRKHGRIHTLVDQKTNEEVLQELKVEPVDKKLYIYIYIYIFFFFNILLTVHLNVCL